MSKVIVTTDLQSMLIDFGDYASTVGIKNAAFDKDYVKTFELSPDGLFVVLKVSDSIRYYVTYDQSNINTNYFIVDSVEGVVPTSNIMLLNLLSQTKYVTYLSKLISTASTTIVKTGWGVIHSINILSVAASSSVKIYDGIDATGTLLFDIPISTTITQGQISIPADVRFFNGLTVVTTVGLLSALSKVQISYK